MLRLVLKRFLLFKMSKSTHNYWYFFICVFLILSTFVLYWPVHNHNFIYYDDIQYIVNNPHVNTGLSWQNFLWAFNIGYASNWHPLTWLSHMLDCQLFGLNPGPQHIINVCFHIANTLLLFIVLQRMTRALWASALVSTVFALHPLHIESVAWLAERKDVLSTFFWMLTMLAYARYAERPNPARYITTLLLFALGLMAKPMLVTLPFVLLLLDYWPLERIRTADETVNNNLQNNSSPRQAPLKNTSTLILEKAPFFILSLASGPLTLLAQRIGGSVVSVDALILKNRLANAVVSYTAYIGKMFWPSRLAVLYPHPVSQLPLTKVIYSTLLLLLITVLCIYFSRRLKFLAVGWLWYIGTLIPVIGIVQVGAQSMADRYTYVPLTGLFIILAWTAREIVRRCPYLKPLLVFLVAIMLLALPLCSLVQLTHWRDSSALLKHTIDVTENNHIILSNYANILRHDGQLDEAIKLYYKALRIRPNSPQVFNNLGLALQDKGNNEEAIICFQKAIELTKNKMLKPNQSKGLAEANYNLANILRKQQRFQEALQYYNKALELTPNDADTLHGLGVTLAELKEYDQAIKHYQKALQLRPGSIITHGQLGLALAAIGKFDEAIEHFRTVLKAQPDDAEIHFNLGALLQKQGKIDEAIESYRRALELNPDLEKARIQLNAALANQKSNH